MPIGRWISYHEPALAQRRVLHAPVAPEKSANMATLHAPGDIQRKG